MQNKAPKPTAFEKLRSLFLMMIPIVAAKENKTKLKLMASVDDQDIKNRNCEHPAIIVIILFKEGDKPVLLPSNLTAKTKTTAATMSKMSTALNSLPVNFKKGIMAKENPGGNICCVSKIALSRLLVKYFVTPIPLPANRF